MIDLALQITLAVLLLLTITWCVIVHFRLSRLRVDHGEMAAFITALGEATSRAETVVQHMSEASRAVEASAQEQQRRGRKQSEELARLMDNAIRVAKRLDSAVEQGATRLAELRTRPTTQQSPELVSPANASARRHPPTKPSPSTSEPPPAGSHQPTRARQPIRPLPREGQLNGLLHGELLEALQGLR